MGKRSAIILGSTGLVGNELAGQLADEGRYDRVLLAVRRPTGRSFPGTAEVVVDYGNAKSLAKLKVQDVFCCLGTTIKKAGSKEAFRRVDHDLPVEAGRALRDAGAGSFLLVSALGADTTSSIFYNRVKGEVEQSIAALGYPSVHIFRPSLLLGDRPELRPGEKVGEIVGRAFGFAFVGALQKYRPIEAADVARGMLVAAALPGSGVRYYESDEIRTLAEGTR